MEELKSLVLSIRKIYTILDKGDKRNAFIVFINIFLSGLLETLSVGIIVPFIMAIMSPESLRNNKYIYKICEKLGIDSDIELLVLMGVCLIIVFFVKNIYLIFSSFLQVRFRYRMQEKLSIRMLSSYLKRPYTYFIETNSSEIIRGLGSDVGNVKDAIETFFILASQVITLIMISIYLLITDFFLAIGILGTSVLCTIVITGVFKNRVKILGIIQREANAAVNKYAYEAINGVKEIIAMRKQEKFINAYRSEYKKTRKSNISYSTISACPSRVIETAFIAGIIIFVCMRIASGLEPEQFVPQFAAFAVGGMKMLPSIAAISSAITALLFQQPGVNATYENIQETEVYEKEKQVYIGVEDVNEKRDFTKFKEIRIQNVYWKYVQADKKVLDGLSLQIKRGESIAFIGESGSGKTTLVDIILGLFKPQKGNILLDGIDIHANLDEWSKIIAYVQQSVFLMDDTIKNNIAFGIPEDEIDEAKVWRALEQAQLKEFVLQKPEGIDTLVGERGVKFSGGQRQRIAIARALYHDPQILVLDEATAALDNETEEAVLQSIEALQGQKTLIIVAHRLTTVRNCDKIYEIRDGKAFLKSKNEVFDK